MRTTALEPTIQQLRQALGQGDRPLDPQAAVAALTELHPSDIASVLDELTLPEALAIFRLLDDALAAEVLDEVSPQTNRYLVENSPRERIAALLDLLPMDDAAELVSEVGPEDGQPLLAHLAATDAADVQELLAFPEGTAGRLMTSKFAVVRPTTTAAQALEYLRREAAELETVNVVYVMNGGGRLAGVCSIRDLLTARPGQAMGNVMTAEPISVSPETDQQEVARLISRYDLLAIPVVDSAGRILGIVTVDDVIDVLVEEFNEDYARLVGTDAEELERRPPAQIALLRMPWIMATLFIELLAGVVIHLFDATLTRIILLASFMPIISAISGNTGLQSATIIVRGLSTGHIQVREWRHALARQFVTTLILGGACGAVLGVIGAVWYGRWTFGLVVAIGMFMSVNIAGVVGTAVPMISKSLGFDPALTAGPFETAFQDVVGISIFLGLATFLLHWLQ